MNWQSYPKRVKTICHPHAGLAGSCQTHPHKCSISSPACSCLSIKIDEEWLYQNLLATCIHPRACYTNISRNISIFWVTTLVPWRVWRGLLATYIIHHSCFHWALTSRLYTPDFAFLPSPPNFIHKIRGNKIPKNGTHSTGLFRLLFVLNFSMGNAMNAYRLPGYMTWAHIIITL